MERTGITRKLWSGKHHADARGQFDFLSAKGDRQFPTKERKPKTPPVITRDKWGTLKFTIKGQATHPATFCDSESLGIGNYLIAITWITKSYVTVVGSSRPDLARR